MSSADVTDSALTRIRSEEHTSELPSLMRNSYAVFSLKKKTYHSMLSQTVSMYTCTPNKSISDTILLLSTLERDYTTKSNVFSNIYYTMFPFQRILED